MLWLIDQKKVALYECAINNYRQLHNGHMHVRIHFCVKTLTLAPLLDFSALNVIWLRRFFLSCPCQRETWFRLWQSVSWSLKAFRKTRSKTTLRWAVSLHMLRSARNVFKISHIKPHNSVTERLQSASPLSMCWLWQCQAGGLMSSFIELFNTHFSLALSKAVKSSRLTTQLASVHTHSY